MKTFIAKTVQCVNEEVCDGSQWITSKDEGDDDSRTHLQYQMAALAEGCRVWQQGDKQEKEAAVIQG